MCIRDRLGFKALEIAAEHAFAEDDSGEAAAPTCETAEGTGGACGSGSPARTDSPLGCPARAELAPGPSRSLRSEAVEGVHAGGEPSDADAAVSDVEGGTGGSLADEGKGFSWKDDFGRPGTMMDALGAQTSLEVVGGPDAEGSGDADALDGGRPCAAEPEKKSFLDEEAEFGKGAMAVSLSLIHI